MYPVRILAGTMTVVSFYVVFHCPYKFRNSAFNGVTAASSTYTSIYHTSLSNFNKTHIFTHQVKRTVATLLTAWQSPASAFCYQHKELIHKLHTNEIHYIFTIYSSTPTYVSAFTRPSSGGLVMYIYFTCIVYVCNYVLYHM
jgi:hypothetical protein